MFSDRHRTNGNVDGTGAVARFVFPCGAALDGAGNLYVTDHSGVVIRKVVVATGAVTTLAGQSNAGSADGIGDAARFLLISSMSLDGAGNLYIADSGNHLIRKVVAATGEVTTLAGSPRMAGSTDGTGAAARFASLDAVAIDSTGNLYVADNDNNTIRKVVVATGVVTTLAGSPGLAGSTDGAGSAARFKEPSGIAVDRAGNLYVSDQGNRTIRKVVAATGLVTTLAGTPGSFGSTDGIGTAAHFGGPCGLAIDGTGNLYIGDSVGTIRKLVVATGEVTTLAGSPGKYGSTDGIGAAARFSSPYGLTMDGIGNLYVADYDSGKIRKIQVSSGSVTTVVGIARQAGVKLGALPARLNTPYAVAALPSGGLFIADENSVLSAR